MLHCLLPVKISRRLGAHGDSRTTNDLAASEKGLLWFSLYALRIEMSEEKRQGRTHVTGECFISVRYGQHLGSYPLRFLKQRLRSSCTQ